MKISIEFDTNDKTLTVMADGKAISDVAYVSCSKSYYDESGFTCSVETMTKDEANDAMVCTRLCASESTEAKTNQAATESKTLPGFMIIPKQTKLEQAIAAFCSK